MVTFTINASVKSKKSFKTYVSSENVNILNLAKNLKAIPVRRIKKLSSNTTTADEVIYDFIKKLKKEKLKIVSWYIFSQHHLREITTILTDH